MKIVEQSHQIVNPSPQHEHEWYWMAALIEEAGRTCYKSEIGETPDPFLRRIRGNGHHSVLEHGNITVRFVTDRGVTHELVRHRLAAYSQESTRYCDYGGDDVVFVRPVWCSAEMIGTWAPRSKTPPMSTPGRTWFSAMLDAENAYLLLREQGWLPQQARAVLPNSLKTEIVMTANLREWRHVLTLRTSKAAHPQIRELMLPLRAELARLLPAAFEDLEQAAA